MPATPYFYSEALRQRFLRNLRIARTEQRIDAEEFSYLKHLVDTEQTMASPRDSCEVYRLILEDGSPEPFGMVTALLVQRWTLDAQVLYLDTLAHGLLRFSDKKLFSAYLKTAFSVAVEQNPPFYIRLVEGPMFQQCMWQAIDHQAQTLRRLANDLQALPTLSQVLNRLLAARLSSLWPNGEVDLQLPLVQVVEHTGVRHGASREHPVRVQNFEQLALEVLTGKRLPAGQRRRFTGLAGQPLDTIGMSDFDLRMDSLEDEYEHLIGDYWNNPDRCAVTRRQRFAQALADLFAHHVLVQSDMASVSTTLLARLATSPLYEPSSVPVSRLALTVDGGEPCKLVSLYLLRLEQGSYGLYSPFKGLRLLKNRQALNDLLDSPTGRRELRNYLSLKDQNALPALEAWVSLRITDHPLEQPLFYHCIEAVIGLQMSNLATALRQRCRDEGELRAMLDDALDVRLLIDGRLPGMGGGGRWLSEPMHFPSAWPAAAKPVSVATQAPVPSWGEQLSRIEDTLSEISDRRPSLQQLAGQLLHPYLAALGYSRPGAGDHLRLTCSEQVLERLSGARRAPLATWPTGGEGEDMINAELLEQMVSRVATTLEATCTASIEAFYEQPLRSARTQQRVSLTLRALREQLLRLELVVARRKYAVAPSLLDLLQSVLDRPSSTLHRDLVDVHAVSIGFNGKRFALGLNVAWVMQLPDQPEQNLLFWSPFIGLKMMNSRAALQTWLQARLANPDWRTRWLEMFPGQDRQWVDSRLAAGASVTVTLDRADGDFLQRMQQDGRQRVVDEYAVALRDARQQHLPVEALTGSVDLASNDDWLLTWLDAMAIRIQNLLFTSAMPDWVTMASLEDLDLYTALLQAYFRDNAPADDFLADVPLLHDFARQRLLEALQRDFPGHDLDPDLISVTTTRYAIAPVTSGNIPMSVPGATLTQSESLVEFSLNHFSQVEEGTLTVGLPGGLLAPAGLDGQYVARLVHDLDVGLHYQRLLAERFDPARPEYETRRERFMRQVPSRLLVTAMEMKLQGLISQTAFDYLALVLDMPDDAARQAVQDQHVVLRPLTLVARRGMPADPVEGFFLIGPKDIKRGPVVLHIQFSEWFSLREFRDHDHLLAELRAEGPLQTLLLSRLDAQMRKRYDHGGLIEAHMPFSTEGVFDTTLFSPEQVKLGTVIVEGNALRHLFDSLVQLMRRLSCKQAVTSDQADWAAFVRLMGLVTEQVLIFAPGKLGLLVSLWQTRNLMRQSVSAASERQWGEALGEFTAALGMLVTARREENEPLRPRARPRPTIFSWRNSALSPELRERLSEFEVLDVELSSLRYDALYNLYQDPSTQTRYAVVEGKVYQVHQFEGVWRIKGITGEGPGLRLDGEQRWQLNLELGLRGGSPSPDSSEAMQTQINTYITVRAEGMKNIRLYSREEARKINMARYQALGYLKNALFNLNAPTAQGVAKPVRAVLNDFFGVEEVSPAMIDGVRQRLTEVFVGLCEPSLAPLSSSRFVLGAAKSGYESMAAFVMVGDPRRRVFLSDMFFSPPTYSLKDVLPGNRAFSAEDHFRASILIHEMSHQACETVDFAYLDASAPPVDMIDDSEPEWLSYRTQLQALRDEALSHRTPGARLFRIYGRDGWRDLQPSDGRLFGKLIRLTGQPTLERSRQAFLSDPAVRSRVILGNADSVAMLASLLGRERFS
ncbi:hypothetical protein EGJ27_17475 [Pseudomonas sp. v388]|uniref:dermonecrotic toxin domain-containing protein n=1 Tax=Pseudomonas sp. v388 TaxID=2479849 RepID=UPI000F76FC7F|nr:DUF6543 domain-containing protein [Pseudomonas sp. v388]RRV05605.1 hypothetical protein EGJ27_17475 [Pseudomonas sp. v388]